MTFAWPHLLWLLLIPAGFLGWELTHRRRQVAEARPKILKAEAGAHSLHFSADKPARANSTGPRVWLALGLALAVVALARPQWGKIEEPVFDQSREILLAVDLSRSMLTPDVKPSRLDRSKLLIQSLLERLAGERVGLVVFSGTAFLQSPLSADYEILREFLPALGPDFLPEGGTNYRALIDAAIDAFTTSASADRFLIVLSDGEATDEAWRPRVAELKKRNIRVIGLGVGTAGGAMIPDGSGGFVKDERGAVVLSRLEGATLQELGDATGGTYRDASTWVDLAALLQETVEAGQTGEFVEKNTVRFVERFQWPLALGLWCLLVSVYFEFPVRPRTRDIRLTAPNALDQGAARREQAEIGVASAALLMGMMLAAQFLLATPARAAVPAPEPGLSPLGKMVGRLAAAPVRTARDWAEFARETVTWGTGLQSQQQSVPEGPVRDALSAVDLGSRSDASTANWPKLREELEALLRKPEEDQQQQEDKDQQQQDRQQQQQNQDQQKQEQQQNKPEQQKDQKSEPQDPSPDQEDRQQQQSQPQKPEQQPPGESAFGDMSEKQEPPPPPPPGDTRKVGGTPDQKEQPNEPMDPALALPLQKLDQLRNQDSPAQLFQLMEGEKKQTKKSGKDW